MEYQAKNRDWVKNAAIIFLAVLLVLTFFSNTIMNRSLPEVATQSVQGGSITAKVRGTGTVTAAGTHTVKAAETREIRAVMVKAGQSVNAGDVLFVLGEGDSAEVEAAQEQLRQLQLSYQRAAIGVPVVSYKAEEREIEKAKQALSDAQAALAAVQEKSTREIPSEQMDAAKQEVLTANEALTAAKADLTAKQELLESKKIDRDAILSLYNDKVNTAYDRVQEQEYWVEKYTTELHDAQGVEPPGRIAELQEGLRIAKEALADATQYLNSLQSETARTEVETAQTAVKDAEAAVTAAQETVADAETTLAAAQAKVEAIQAVIDEIMGAETVSAEYKQAKEAVQAAEDTLFTLQNNLELKKISDSKSQSLSYLDLTDIGQQIEKAKQKLAELSGGEENQILAKVSGTVQSVECIAGETKAKDEVLATIEVPDLGYTLSFTVTNDQARRLKVGDSATVSNYYWGNSITATLESIRTDPKNPQTNKLLTFNLTGDVNAGSELTISVGQKSANYDLVVPNSAIRSDANGQFVLKIESKSSPLGNRYIARRVNVEVLAEDDMNSAVTGDLSSWGEYVITTSNAPVKNGDMVRLADNG